MARFIAAGLVGLLLAMSHVHAADDTDEEDDDEYVGTALVLTPANADAELKSNVGGLVILIVPEPGGKPAKDLKVDAPKTFKKAGILKAMPVEVGKEYSCHLFEPSKEGEATISLSFADAKGEKVEKTYKIAVGPEPEEKE